MSLVSNQLCLTKFVVLKFVLYSNFLLFALIKFYPRKNNKPLEDFDVKVTVLREKLQTRNLTVMKKTENILQRVFDLLGKQIKIFF